MNESKVQSVVFDGSPLSCVDVPRQLVGGLPLYFCTVDESGMGGLGISERFWVLYD